MNHSVAWVTTAKNTSLHNLSTPLSQASSGWHTRTRAVGCQHRPRVWWSSGFPLLTHVFLHSHKKCNLTQVWLWRCSFSEEASRCGSYSTSVYIPRQPTISSGWLLHTRSSSSIPAFPTPQIHRNNWRVCMDREDKAEYDTSFSFCFRWKSIGCKKPGTSLKLLQPQEANKFESKDCSVKLHLSIPGLISSYLSIKTGVRNF